MLEKVYAPAAVEPKWVDAWRSRRNSAAGTGEPYVIVIPPPNVTGALHIGHGLDNTLQDALIRWHRLAGRPTCWVPGADHGGIATQSVMEKQLKAEGLARHQIGREKFLARMQAWVAECKQTILGQLARLGCLLDWEREAFTMDEARSRAVFAAFQRLWDKGLIARGERMVNWCVRCGTALSDIEVEFEERKGKLWHIRYPGADGGPGVVIATTRPETLLGDTAVAVHPADARYAGLVGKTVRLPLMDRPIPVIGDEAVDSSFGTGALKVTPAHDPNDHEIGLRHALPAPKVIGPDGRMSEAAGRYAGLSREACRDKVVEDLGELLLETREHPHSVGVCYRCSSVIEPLLSWQWFVTMKPLAEPAIAALDSGAFKIFPESWAKPYRNWLVNIRDWCISRQIWWGHRIPVWYCRACNRGSFAEGSAELSVHQLGQARGIVSAERPARCADCGGADFLQDPDVLDTWFSSGLWPFAVFGWPGESPELARFYPTETLVTGYEILYLWVARMQMLGLELRGEVPFHHAYIHGIVRDKRGKKMSKSLGNVIDPLVMMDKYGTDAFRFALVSQAFPAKDIPFAEESLVGPRNFANKIWNTARFALMNFPESAPAGGFPPDALAPSRLDLADRWLLSEYQELIDFIRARMERYELAAAANGVYAFLWEKFCDWYVELAKPRLTGPDAEDALTARAVIAEVLTGTLKLLHPFMPFVTEELYQSLAPFAAEASGSIADSGLPVAQANRRDPEAVGRMERLMGMVVALRTLRAELNVPPGLRLSALYRADDSSARELLAERGPYLNHLARLERLEPAPDGGRPDGCASAVAAGVVFFVPLAGIVDLGQERARLGKDLAQLKSYLAQVDARLANPEFAQKAPPDKVEASRVQRGETVGRIARIEEILGNLTS